MQHYLMIIRLDGVLMKGILRAEKRTSTLIFVIIFLVIFYNNLPDMKAFPTGDKLPVPTANHSSGKTKLHLSSYFHLRYTRETDAGSNPWSLRRFKLYAKTKISSRWLFAWQFIYKRNHNHKTDDRIYLQHIYLKYTWCDVIQFKFGQFKPPFGWERFQPDYLLPNPERAMVIDKLIPAGAMGASFARDYGFQLEGHLPGHFVKYEVAAMAGSGANTKISLQNGHLWVLRLGASRNLPFFLSQEPLAAMLQVAVSIRKADDLDFTGQLAGADKTIFTHFSGNDRRMNIALILRHGGTQFVSEYLSAKFTTLNGFVSWLADGYYFQLNQKMRDRWQVFLKYERFDPDHSVINSADMTRTTMGLSYYLKQQGNRLMFSYTHKTERRDASKNDVMMLQYQYFLFRS